MSIFPRNVCDGAVVVVDGQRQGLLLETDAPYIAPVPYRGKRNEPKFMVEVLKKMAQVFDHTEERVDEITTLSAKELFGIG